MKERPILFSAQMVRALIDGRKTQTRRVINWKQIAKQTGCTRGRLAWSLLLKSWAVFDGNGPADLCAVKCPHGEIGDRLWVKEAWYTAPIFNKLKPSELSADVPIHYAADDAPEIVRAGPIRSPLFMQRRQSRITLEIVNARVERLQDISPDDAIAEGFKKLTKDGGRTFKYGLPDRDGLPGNDDHGWHWADWRMSPVDAYEWLWESISGAGSWAKNPWVWVIDFRRLDAQ